MVRRGLWLWALIVAALLIALPAIVERAALEQADRVVHVVIDQERLEDLSKQTGVPAVEILTRWGELGVTGLAVHDADGARLAAAAGLQIVPRNVQVAVLAAVYGWETGPVVFSGDRVGGYPDRLPSMAALLDYLDAPLGLIEFAAQHGTGELARLLDFRVVRVHSIPLEELARLSDADAAARFARAARERHVRVLYVRPLVRGPADEMLARNEAYIRDIVLRLEEAGLLPGTAEALPFWRTSPAVPVAAAAAAAAAALLLAGRLWSLPGWLAALALLAAGAAVYGLGHAGYTIPARQMAALAVSLAFPPLAVLSAMDRLDGLGRHTPQGADRRRVLGRWILAVVQFGAVTAAGALLVAAALGDSRFLVQMEQFRGVKLAHVLPLAVVALFWLRDRNGGSWLAWLNAPVRVWHLLAAGAVLLAGYIYVGRTGNDMVAILDVERALRVTLENALAVRPRTKEFLLGYPALLIGLGLWAARRRALAWPFVAAGTVASISVINTFAHAHAPLAVSAVRSAYGFVAGVVVAAVAGGMVWLVRRLPPRSAGRAGTIPGAGPG